MVLIQVEAAQITFLLTVVQEKLENFIEKEKQMSPEITVMY